MRRDGRDVSLCAITIGPGRTVEFEQSGAPTETTTVDELGDDGVYRRMELWAGDLQSRD